MQTLKILGFCFKPFVNLFKIQVELISKIDIQLMNNKKYLVDWYFGWIKVFENMIFNLDI
jgi:hypothetical protein